MAVLDTGLYAGRTVEDVLILDPVHLLDMHENGGYTLTPSELRQALRNIDEVDTCSCDDTYGG